jgi:hypothetical protein
VPGQQPGRQRKYFRLQVHSEQQSTSFACKQGAERDAHQIFIFSLLIYLTLYCLLQAWGKEEYILRETENTHKDSQTEKEHE